MHIRLDLPRDRLRRWHLWLIKHLQSRAGTAVSVRFTNAEAKQNYAIKLLLALESLVARGPHEAGADLLTPHDVLDIIGETSERHPDLVIRFGQHETTASDYPVITVLYDGMVHEDAMWLALVERRAPVVTFRLSKNQQAADAVTIAILPALEARHALNTSANAIFSRMVEMLAASIQQGQSRNADLAVLSATDRAIDAPSSRFKTSIAHSAQFIARRLADKATSTLNSLLKTGPQWSVAWRPAKPIDPAEANVLNTADLFGIPCDAGRYFADPFPISINGRTFLFVEEFPFSTGRGLISMCEIGDNGQLSTPAPILETPFHLSYPQVFTHDDHVWMLPEASASGGVDLYRANRFPDRWQHHVRLIDEPLHDATIYCDGTRWWIFAATRFMHSSSWCSLKVFFADELLGPWQPLSGTPLKVDARTARPGGSLMQTTDALWRPAQNCDAGYGHALSWCRVDALTPSHFTEAAAGSLSFAPGNRCLGPHTWTSDGTIDTVDLFAAPAHRPAPRFASP